MTGFDAHDVVGLDFPQAQMLAPSELRIPAKPQRRLRISNKSSCNMRLHPLTARHSNLNGKGASLGGGRAALFDFDLLAHFNEKNI